MGETLASLSSSFKKVTSARFEKNAGVDRTQRGCMRCSDVSSQRRPRDDGEDAEKSCAKHCVNGCASAACRTTAVNASATLAGGMFLKHGEELPTLREETPVHVLNRTATVTQHPRYAHLDT